MKPLTDKNWNSMHTCNCNDYNGGQCYNCLNGAHENCDTCKQENDDQLGVLLVYGDKQICMSVILVTLFLAVTTN